MTGGPSCEWGIRDPRREGRCTLTATYSASHTVEPTDGTTTVYRLLTCHVHKRVADRLGLPVERHEPPKEDQ